MQEKRMQGESAKQVAIDVLRKARQPLRAKEIAKRVVESGRCAGLKGKTPEATISAMLAVGSKPGGPFTRVEKGTYTVAAASGKSRKATATKKRTPAPPPAKPGKKQSNHRAETAEARNPEQSDAPEAGETEPAA